MASLRKTYITLSPDGKWVAVGAEEQGQRDIWLHDVERGSKRRLASQEGSVSSPTWSASGDQVAFSNETEIWIRPADISSEAVKVTEGRYPHFSADGRWIAYSTRDSGQIQIFVKRLPSGEGLWQISTNGGTRPQWSPDGDEVFYLRLRLKNRLSH